MTTPSPLHSRPICRGARLLPFACLLFIASIAPGHAAGAGRLVAGERDRLEAPPPLQTIDAGGDADATARGASERMRPDAAAGAAQAAAVRREMPVPAAQEAAQDWRVHLNLARAPGDRPSSATLAQRGVVVSLSRAF